MRECDCARSFSVELGREGEYRRFKQLLNHARFPTFVGRDTVRQHARQGGLLFYTLHGRDVATTLVNVRISVWLVVAIEPEHQRHGLGTAVLDYLMPNFSRVIEEMVPWFERRGYVKLGDEPYQSRRYKTWLMVRESLLQLAGRVHEHLGERCDCATAILQQLRGEADDQLTALDARQPDPA